MSGKPKVPVHKAPVQKAEKPVQTEAVATTPKKTENANTPSNKSNFGGQIPAFLKIDISHLLKGN